MAKMKWLFPPPGNIVPSNLLSVIKTNYKCFPISAPLPFISALSLSNREIKLQRN